MVEVQEIEWLTHAIHSVTVQTHKDWEVVVVNDASERRLTWAKRRFGKNAGKFEPFDRTDDVVFTDLPKEKHGVACARNHAAFVARGELLAPLDHDDFLEQDALAWMVESWKNHGGVIYGDLKLFGRDSERTWKSREGCNELLKDVVAWNTSLFSKADWIKAGGWNENLAYLEDWDLNLRFIEHDICLNHVSKVMAWYRQRPDSRMGKLKADPNAWAKAYAELRSYHVEFFNGRLKSMCCGPQIPAAAPPQDNRVRAQAVPVGSRVLIKYVGARGGSFHARGPSGVAYMIPGSGEYIVTQPDGLIGVDPADASFFLRMNGGKDFIQM
jgi:glycosyltransferase involved in cell wall biosynthesis